MPKFIGRVIPGAVRIEDNASPPGLVRLTFAQAKLLQGHNIRCSLDTSDRGGEGRLAKRWMRWLAEPAAIIACSSASTAMLIKAARELNLSLVDRKGITHTAKFGSCVTGTVRPTKKMIDCMACIAARCET
jgi:hypothetical protein